MKIFRFCFLSMFVCAFAAKGQTLEQAKAWYLQGEYAQAKPVFEAELQLKPSDPSLNLWYGVSVYETGGDINLAESHVRQAASKNVPNAFLYLGDILAKKYLFDQAMAEYDKFLRLKKKDKAAADLVTAHREQAEKYSRFVKRTEDIRIIDSMVVDKAKFLAAYKLSRSSGRLALFNELFDTKEKTDATAFINEKGSKIYYSQKADNAVFGLYSMEKLLEQYGNEKRVSPNNFGMKGDQNYPFVMTDGVTLYFAAKDDDTMGGYDLFVTRYNLNNDSYLVPERLNMPFNSVYNDYLMVIDEEKGVGWFASDRFQPQGKVCVYTFIPNQQVKTLEGESLEYLASRARITSIKDTWRKGENYSQLIATARKTPVDKVEVKRDFEFVINDRQVYHSLKDFKSEEARDLFVQLTKIEQLISEKENEQDQKREAYSQADTVAKREMTQGILTLEKEIEDLRSKQQVLTIRVRNTENRAAQN